jgi:hypothetical protein
MKTIKNNLKNIGLVRLIVLFAMTFVINVFSMKLSEWPKMVRRYKIIQKQKLLKKQEQEQALQRDKSLHTLYAMSYIGRESYIPQKELVDSDGKQINLRDLFKKHNICLGWPEELWDEEETWKKIYSELIQRATKEKADYMISPDELPRLLLDAKTIIKKFLITDDDDLPVILNTYIKKSGINRLFTYAKLKRVIEEKNLTHVRLPRKFLIILDKKTNRYISSEKSPEIIDTVLKFCINPISQRIGIDDYDTRYDLKIFAQKEYNAGNFNTAAEKELLMLCKEAPFDVGYDNIFSDNEGNAIIIDTEFKGEPANQACPKLSRYKKEID